MLGRDSDLEYIIETFEIASEVEELRALRFSLPPIQAWESVAISFAPKIAALAFDRVWCGGMSDEIPDGIQCFAASQDEIAFVLLSLWSDFAVTAGVERYELAAGNIFEKFGMPSTDPDSGLRIVAEAVSARLGVAVTPIYLSSAPMRSSFSTGPRAAVVASLHNLALARERDLCWAQVEEFRADRRSVTQYRALINWHDAAMVGKSRAQVDDAIAARLENYHVALKKHGVMTGAGAATAILDSRQMPSDTDVREPTVPQLAGLLAAAGSIFGGTRVEARVAELDLADVGRGRASVVAFLHEETGPT